MGRCIEELQVQIKALHAPTVGTAVTSLHPQPDRPAFEDPHTVSDPSCAEFMKIAAAARERPPHFMDKREEQVLAICDIPRRLVLPNALRFLSLAESPVVDEDQG
eukprot:2556021-Karenia_brevis.AAC.1